jgi:hypothetical protein
MLEHVNPDGGGSSSGWLRIRGYRAKPVECQFLPGGNSLQRLPIFRLQFERGPALGQKDRTGYERASAWVLGPGMIVNSTRLFALQRVSWLAI